MRIHNFTFFVLVGASILSFKSAAQCTLNSGDSQSNVSTPKGSPVNAIITAENTNSWRGYFDGLYATSNRTYQYYFGGSYSSSRRFNCHGYAWHMIEGGNVRWIGYCASNVDEHVYWQDGSYVQVCNEMYPGKVSWGGSGDHSAITTATPGRWISKWNEYPLVEHDWNDTPYGTANLKYYVSTNITGSTSLLCSGTRTFNAQSISGASYTWSVSGTLSITSGQGTNTVTIQRNGSNSGQGWVEVQISTPCSPSPATSKKEYFYVGTPVQPGFISFTNAVGGQGYWCSSHYGNLFSESDNLNTPSVSYEANLLSIPNGTLVRSNSNASIGSDPFGYVPQAYYTFQLRAVNGCGSSPWSETEIEYTDCNNNNNFRITAYPNPASTDLNITIDEESSDVKSLSKAEKVGFAMYDGNRGQMTKEWTFDNSTNARILDVRTMKPGKYLLIISKGKYQSSTHIFIE